MRQVRRPLLWPSLLFAAALAGQARADEMESSGYDVSDERDNGVASTGFSLSKTFWQRTKILLEIDLDQVTVPALSPDGISGASRPRRNATREFRKSRGQIITGLEQGLGPDTRVAANYYFSHEVDYASQGVMGSIARDFLQKNFTLQLSGQYLADDVGEITQTGALINRFKETRQASLAATQLLSRTTIFRTGADGFRQEGFLSDPYLPSAHPAQLWRQAVWAEVRQYLPGLEGAVHLHYRYYWDDWSKESHAVRLQLHKYLSPDWIFSPWYRYYIQSGAFFADSPGTAEFHTSDPKQLAYESNMFGAELTWYLRSLARKRKDLDFLGSSSLHILYFRYFRADHLGRPADNVAQARLNFDY